MLHDLLIGVSAGAIGSVLFIVGLCICFLVAWGASGNH